MLLVGAKRKICEEKEHVKKKKETARERKRKKEKSLAQEVE